MRSRIIAILGLAGSLMIGACSSSADHKSNAKPDADNANSQIAATSGTNGNTSVIENGSFVPPQAVDANLAAAEPLDAPGQLQDRMDKMRKSGGAASQNVDPRALALKNAQPAPDNSTFTSYLSDAGYEIRTFKSHPQLLRAEKRIDNEGHQTLKIFLRNGQVIERSGKDLPVLSNAAADLILSIAGVTPPRPKTPSTSGPVPTKKEPAN